MSNADADSQLAERILGGDEAAFETLIDENHRGMVRFAKSFVDDESTAEEVVQETWTAVIDGLDDFEGRSSLETWIYSILTNIAKKRGEKDARTVTWSSVSESTIDAEVAEEGDRFNVEGRWSVPPVPWNTDPEAELLRSQLLDRIQSAIEQLPARQQAVVTLRDVQGFSPEETCEVLEITDGNHRVLLHRGRSKVREALESYLAEEEAE